MKTRSILGALGMLVGLTLPLAAQQDGSQIQAILADIKQEQNVQQVAQIDPSKASDSQLVALGEAVIEVMFANKRQHVYVDAMMRGGGSGSLEAFHHSIGYSYLTGRGAGPWGVLSSGRSGWSMKGPWCWRPPWWRWPFCSSVEADI